MDIHEYQAKEILAGFLKVIEVDSLPEFVEDLIGEIVMDHLARIDTVAYVRFASVYKSSSIFNSRRGENMSRHTMKMKFDGIISILAKNLYTEPDVFLRELIQNGHDALVKRSRLDSDFAPDAARIDISLDQEQRTITVTDNGAGLSEEERQVVLAELEAVMAPYQGKAGD